MANITHEEKDKVLAAQQAEIEKLKAELEAKNGAAAQERADKDAKIAELEKLLQEQKDAKATAPASDSAPEPVKTKVIELYKDEKITEDVQVFVNGRQYIIQRGVQVEVPMEVFEVLQNQQKMRNHIIAYNAKHADKK